MQSELESIGVILDLPDSDWRRREEGLKRLGIALASGSSDAIEVMNKHAKGVAIQLADVRSGIAKQASEAVLALCASLKAHRVPADKFVENFMKDQNLIRALASANKVIAGHASLAFVTLFENDLVSFTSLDGLLAAAKASKSGQLKEKIAAGFAIFARLNTGRLGRQPRLRADQIEWLRKSGDFFAADAAAAVRAAGKELLGFLPASEGPTAKNKTDRPLSMRKDEDKFSRSKMLEDKFGSAKTKDDFLRVPVKAEDRYSSVRTPDSKLRVSNRNEPKLEERYGSAKTADDKFRGTNRFVDERVGSSIRPGNERLGATNRLGGSIRPADESFGNSTRLGDERLGTSMRVGDEKFGSTRKPEERAMDFWTAVRSPSAPPKLRSDALRRSEKPRIASRMTLEEFREILEAYESCENVDVQRHLSEVLAMADLGSFGPGVLEFLAGAGSKNRAVPSFLEEKLIESFGLEAFVSNFLASNNFASLSLLAVKLEPDAFERMLAGHRGRPQGLALVSLLAKNVTRVSNSLDFRVACLNCLSYVASLPLVRSALAELDELQVFLDFAARHDVEFPDLEKPSLKKNKNKIDNQLDQSLNSNFPTQLFPLALDGLASGTDLDTKALLRALRSGLESLENSPLSEQTSLKAAKRCVTLVKRLLSVKDEPAALALLGKACNLHPEDSSLLSLAHQTTLSSFGRSRVMREPSVKAMLSMPHVDKLLIFLFEVLEDSVQDSTTISDAVKALTGVLKQSRNQPIGEFLEQHLKKGLGRLVSSIKNKLIVHYEVNVRKNSVHLLVEMNHFFHPDVFAHVMAQFSIEHQKLVKKKKKKSVPY